MSEKTRWPGIYDLGGGRYRIRVYDPRTREYRQERISGLKNARDRHAQLKAEVQMVAGGRHPGRVPTVKEFGESWRTELIHAPGTASDIEVSLRVHIYPVLGNYRVDRISHRQALAFIRKLIGSDLAKATQGKIDGHIRMLFHAVVADGWLDKSPFEHVDRVIVPKRAARRQREYVPSMAEALLMAELAKDEGRLYMWAFIRMLAGTGLRGGELCGLSVEQLDYPQPTRIELTQQLQYKSGMHFLAPPKTDDGIRTVPLAGWVADTLAVLTAAVDPFEVSLPWVEQGTIRRQQSATLLFSGRYGPAPLQETVANRAVVMLAARAGLSGRVTAHSLRKTYTTVLHDGGVGPRVVDFVTGHASEGVTLGVYTDVTAAGLRRATDAVQQAFLDARDDVEQAMARLVRDGGRWARSRIAAPAESDDATGADMRDMSISCPAERRKAL